MHDQQHDSTDDRPKNNFENLSNKNGIPSGDTQSETDDQFTAGSQTSEIATNDGSVVETLDTALHGTPGWSEGENISGSNRADYYEARSNGKSDVEEEVDELRRANKNSSVSEGKPD